MVANKLRQAIAIVLALVLAGFWEIYVVPKSGNSLHVKAMGAGIIGALSFAIANIICKKYKPAFNTKDRGDLVTQTLVGTFVFGWLLAAADILNTSLATVWDAFCIALAVSGVTIAFGIPYYFILQKRYKMEADAKSSSDSKPV